MLSYAKELYLYHYNSSTRIWADEINVRRTDGTNINFSDDNQAYAALFIDGGLGSDSLPGALAAYPDYPQLTRYIYLRADDDNTDANSKEQPYSESTT